MSLEEITAISGLAAMKDEYFSILKLGKTMNDDNDSNDATETTENDDNHFDLNVMLMDHVEYREYSLSLRPSLNDFLKSKEAQYKPK
jgi:hypothetical protein